MAKPRLDLQEKDYIKSTHFLYEILNILKNVEEVKWFLKDILSSSELRMLKKRWHIASLLIQGLDIRTIAHRTQSSTQTVMRIKQTLEEGKGGLKIAVQRTFEIESKQKKEYIKNKIPKQSSKFVKGWTKK